MSLPEVDGTSDGAKAMARVLQAMTNGEMTPSEASSVAGVIETYRKALETALFESRLQSLEQMANHANS